MVTGTIYASIIDPQNPIDNILMDYQKIILGIGGLIPPNELKNAATIAIFKNILQVLPLK